METVPRNTFMYMHSQFICVVLYLFYADGGGGGAWMDACMYTHMYVVYLTSLMQTVLDIFPLKFSIQTMYLTEG